MATTKKHTKKALHRKIHKVERKRIKTTQAARDVLNNIPDTDVAGLSAFGAMLDSLDLGNDQFSSSLPVIDDDDRLDDDIGD